MWYCFDLKSMGVNRSSLNVISKQIFWKWKLSFFLLHSLWCMQLWNQLLHWNASNAMIAKMNVPWWSPVNWRARIGVWNLSELTKRVKAYCDKFNYMIKITTLPLFSVNDHKKTVKKRCSSEMGCDYFFNVQNYTVHGCQLCSAQLCNEGSRLDLSHAFFLFTIIPFLLISN